MTVVALIPARAGSKRIPHKNTRAMGGHPLVAWTILAARQSGIFAEIRICTDDPDIVAIGQHYGVGSYLAGPPCHVDTCADITWVQDAMSRRTADAAFAILRPTSPFRTAATIRLAWQCFRSWPCDSLRAMRLARENPYKMWTGLTGMAVTPFIDAVDSHGTPWHSLPSQQTMGALYVQTAGLEIAHTRVLHADPPTISGRIVYPFHLEGPESLDINTEDDWRTAEELVATGKVPRPTLLHAASPPSLATATRDQ